MLVASLGMIPARLTDDPSAWWTLLTSTFLDGGWMLFIGNMWVLYLFGDNVKDRMGPGRYLVFYLLCGLAAEEQQDRLLTLLNGLRQRQRQGFLQFPLEDYSTEEIAMLQNRP